MKWKTLHWLSGWSDDVNDGDDCGDNVDDDDDDVNDDNADDVDGGRVSTGWVVVTCSHRRLPPDPLHSKLITIITMFPIIISFITIINFITIWFDYWSKSLIGSELALIQCKSNVCQELHCPDIKNRSPKWAREELVSFEEKVLNKGCSTISILQFFLPLVD